MMVSVHTYISLIGNGGVTRYWFYVDDGVSIFLY